MIRDKEDAPLHACNICGTNWSIDDGDNCCPGCYPKNEAKKRSSGGPFY